MRVRPQEALEPSPEPPKSLRLIAMGGRGLVVAAMLAAALAACTGADVATDPGPVATPTAVPTTERSTEPPSGTSSGTPAPSTGSGTRPQVARKKSAAGAEAFMRFYYGQVNAAWQGPRASLLDDLTAKECLSCRNFADTARSLEKEHLRYDGPPADIGPSILLPESTTDDVRIQFIYTQNPRNIIRADGSIVERLKKRGALSEVRARWRGSAWEIVEIKLVVPS